MNLVPSISLTPSSACSTVSWISSLVSKMNHPPEPFTPIPFCSTFLQPLAQEISTTTVRGSVTRTSTLPTTTRTTTTDPNSRTTTLLCPSPTPNPWCGITGTFTTDFLTNHIVHHENGVENGKTCDMYDQSLEEGFAGRNTGNDATPDHWFDRACPDLLPPGCLKPSPTPMKGLQKRLDVPHWLAGEFLLQIACSCFITSALPTRTSTITFQYDLQSYTTVSSLFQNRMARGYERKRERIVVVIEMEIRGE
ncbi:hypothetical protein BJ875DRAFT_390318 [Amylocarpus encephaloides]|uniref:Uncharacterized protein n=1 Tax=Amylocarpus encephaloides TaxID=45428 RepID=A0A9P7Y741_9HELO|nr:hypothetical protein BJ875DRAFT_390318 [Amylocarpus encephaloides]